MLRCDVSVPCLHLHDMASINRLPYTLAMIHLPLTA